MAISAWKKYLVFASLIPTTIFSLSLLESDLQSRAVTGPWYNFITEQRAAMQLLIQLLAIALGTGQMLIIYCLLNYSTRIKLSRNGVSLDKLKAWIYMCHGNMDWNAPFKHFVLLLLIFIFSAVPAALWTGSLTPVSTISTYESRLPVASYFNTSLIREYPSEANVHGPSLRTSLGFFGYSPGIQHTADLLASAASASPRDNSSPRIHAKLDNTGFRYISRSYGVGASVGLTDAAIFNQDPELQNTPAMLLNTYTYLQSGYFTTAHCIYNASSDFKLDPDFENGLSAFAASGHLPDSDDGPEYSLYLGRGTNVTVAMGVAHLSNKYTPQPRQYIAIAAGASYSFLNLVQCSMTFKPRVFQITMIGQNRTITVQPFGYAEGKYNDIEPSRNLTNVLLRQFELLINDETNLYTSTVGEALNASIRDIRASYDLYDIDDGTFSSAVLRGVEKSLEAMADDMLTIYDSAQMMVGNFTDQTHVTVSIAAFRLGSKYFILSVVIVNALLVLVVLWEMWATNMWRALPEFDYTDFEHIAMAMCKNQSQSANFPHDRMSDEAPFKDVYASVMSEGRKQPMFILHSVDSLKGRPSVKHEWLGHDDSSACLVGVPSA